MHARSIGFRRRLDDARRIVDREVAVATRTQVAWSGGKDSTAMAHLVVVDRGLRHVDLVSEKDDLDYPGEEEYVRELAYAWGAQLHIVRPATSPSEWLAARARAMDVCDDIHGRSAGLSKACFYSVMEEANRGYDLVMLGLRSEESGRRRALRTARGKAYTLVDGTRRLLPIADWSGMDVFAYLQSVGVEPLPVYRCVALMHAREPWRIRKSWWVPGRNSNNGGVTWLRRYYPSLFERLTALFPNTQSVA